MIVLKYRFYYLFFFIFLFCFTEYAFSKATFSSSYNHTSRFLRGITLNADGTKIYFSMQKTKNGNATSGTDSLDAVDWITLGTAYDLSSAATWNSNDHINVRYKCNTEGNTLVLPGDMRFNNDGTKVFFANETHTDGANVCQMDLTIAYDASTIQDDDDGVKLNNTDSGGRLSHVRGLFFNSDGSKFFVTDYDDDKLYEYALTTKFDIQSLDYTTYFDLSINGITKPTSLAFSKDGKEMFIVDQEGDEVHQWSLSTGFDISSSITYRGSIDVTSDYLNQVTPASSDDDDAHSLTFNADGSKFYITMAHAQSSDDVQWVLEYDLDCPYGVVYCESPVSGSNKALIGVIESYTEMSKRVMKNNIHPVMHRLEWLRRHKDKDNLTNQNLKFNFSNEKLSALSKVIPVGNKKNSMKKYQKGNWFFWSEGQIGFGDIKANSRSLKKEIDTDGITLGADKKVSENKMYGYAIQYGRDSNDIGSSSAILDTDNYSLVYYGSSSGKAGNYLDGAIGISTLQTTHLRTNNSVNLIGKRDGKQVFGSMKLNKIYNKDNTNINPLLRFDLGFTELDEFQESGDAHSLIYDKHQIQKGIATLGLLVDNTKIFNQGTKLKNIFRIEYLNDFSSSNNTNVSYVSDPNTDYFIRIGNQSSHNYKIGLGFDLSTISGWSIIMNYEIQNANGNGSIDNLYLSAGWVPNYNTKLNISIKNNNSLFVGLSRKLLFNKKISKD